MARAGWPWRWAAMAVVMPLAVVARVAAVTAAFGGAGVARAGGKEDQAGGGAVGNLIGNLLFVYSHLLHS